MVRCLPRGVALVRVETPVGCLLWVSDRLSDDEELVAKVIALIRVKMGARAVVLREMEVVEVLHTA